MKIKQFQSLALTGLVFALLLGFTATAQDEKKEDEKEGYEFTLIKEIPNTSVKDQHRSGTCWSFSGISFIESELMRQGKGEFDLSEMWIVRHTYEDKAKKYVRMHGKINFAGGGAFNDVTDMMTKNGMVPEDIYAGLSYGEDKHVHHEMDKVLNAYVDGVIKNRNRKLTTVWFDGYNGILDAYLGKKPETFTYEDKEYTPEAFADEVLEYDPNNYVMLTSYTHHDLYKPFILEVPDNWGWGEVYNLPLDEFMETMNYAIDEGYSIAWAADVSEKGFSWKNGVAIVPEDDIKVLEDTERSRWEDLTEKEKQEQLYSFEAPVQEKNITREMRQKAFDNYKTTDDHGMHIVGKAKDQEGNPYYYVKNSWNTNNIYDGYFYASEPFVAYKTMSILINKEAVPKKIRKKMEW